MYQVNNINAFPQEFSNLSGVYTTIRTPDFVLINMAECLEGTIDADGCFQTLICEHCGTFDCSPGNWVALRRAGDFVLLTPAFAKMDRAVYDGQYDPPLYMTTKGVLWFSITVYHYLKRMATALPATDKIQELSKSELMRLLLWDLPQKRIPTVGDLLATDMESADTFLKCITQECLLFQKADNFRLALPTPATHWIRAYLDDSKTTEWKALYSTGSGYKMVLGNQFLVEYK